jgi:hypothetical protein
VTATLFTRNAHPAAGANGVREKEWLSLFFPYEVINQWRRLA